MKKLLNYFGNLTERRFFVAMFVAAVGLVLSLALLHFALLNSSEFLFDPNSAGKMPWLAKKFIVLLCVVALVLPTVAMSQFFFANKNWVLTHRIHVLVFAGWFGLVLAVDLVYHSEFFIELIGVEKVAGAVEKFIASLCVIVLGLPTLGMLWFFRTNDTLEQIQKTTESVQKTKESTDVSILFGAQKMMSEDDSEKPGVKSLFAFEQLMHLHQQGSYRATIALITRDANLADLTLYSIPMRGADLSEAKLQKARLYGADLWKANLWSADLSEASLDFADLQGANMAFANLQNADLSEADLQGANMQCAKLQHADLRDANLQGADLEEAELSGANLKGAKYSAETKLPAALNPAVEGMDKVT